MKRRSTQSSVPRSAAFTRIFLRKTSPFSMGIVMPALPLTDTVSTGVSGKHFEQVSASR